MFNRYIVNNPVNTNAEQVQSRDAKTGVTTGGFGFIDRTTQQGGAGIGALVNIAPRNGTLVARIRF